MRKKEREKEREKKKRRSRKIYSQTPPRVMGRSKQQRQISTKWEIGGMWEAELKFKYCTGYYW